MDHTRASGSTHSSMILNQTNCYREMKWDDKIMTMQEGTKSDDVMNQWRATGNIVLGMLCGNILHGKTLGNY